MKNWSTDTRVLKKETSKFTIWKLEQMINFGLDGEKLSKKELIAHWDVLEIDPARRRYLQFLLWPKKRS